MAAYLELCDPGQVHSFPWLSVFLSVIIMIIIIIIIIATFEKSLLCVLHCTKLFTNVVSFNPHSNLTGGVDISTPIS